MYLNELKDKEANAFLNLVYQFVMSDDNFDKAEKEITATYYKELGREKENYTKLSYSECVDILKNSTNKVKTIVYIKLMRIALTDGEYEFGEVDFLEKLSDLLEISRVKKMAIANYFYNFSEVEDDEKSEAKDLLNKILND